MKIINNFVVIRLLQIFKSLYAVIIISSYKYICFGSDSPYAKNTFISNFIPYITVFLIGNFIQKFKCNAIMIFSESFCNFFPKTEETFLKFFRFKKSTFRFTLIERKTVSLMKIQNHIQSVFFTPVNAFLNIHHSAFLNITVSVFNKIIIYRDSDMIDTP